MGGEKERFTKTGTFLMKERISSFAPSVFFLFYSGGGGGGGGEQTTG